MLHCFGKSDEKQRIKSMFFTRTDLARQIAEYIDDLLVQSKKEEPRKLCNAYIGYHFGQTTERLKESPRVRANICFSDNFVRIEYKDEVNSFDLTTGKMITHNDNSVKKIARFVKAAILSLQQDIQSERASYEKYKGWKTVYPKNQNEETERFFAYERYNERKNLGSFNIPFGGIGSGLDVFDSVWIPNLYHKGGKTR